METEAEARRRRKAADSAFLEMLRAAAPPVTFTSSWEQAEGQLAADPRWAGVPDAARRRELFDAYISAASQVEAQRVARGQEALTGLLRRLNPEPGTSWEEVRRCWGRGRCRGGLKGGRDRGRGRPGDVQKAATSQSEATGFRRLSQALSCAPWNQSYGVHTFVAAF
jgi:hypothetical protein